MKKYPMNFYTANITKIENIKNINYPGNFYNQEFINKKITDFPQNFYVIK